MTIGRFNLTHRSGFEPTVRIYICERTSPEPLCYKSILRNRDATIVESLLEGHVTVPSVSLQWKHWKLQMRLTRPQDVLLMRELPQWMYCVDDPSETKDHVGTHVETNKSSLETLKTRDDLWSTKEETHTRPGHNSVPWIPSSRTQVCLDSLGTLYTSTRISSSMSGVLNHT